ncbi:MAG TPA: hypothetical protein PLC54_02985 [Spirochaetales bacterium]|nr:hypothetical protein [Spirochaetales bacterium]
MPIKPIDLQTLFMQLGQVGRQQAAEKQAPIIQQAMQGNEAARREAENSKTVHRVDEDKSGTGAIRTDDGGGSNTPAEGKHRDKEALPPPERETIKDPDLGSHVDVSG